MGDLFKEINLNNQLTIPWAITADAIKTSLTSQLKKKPRRALLHSQNRCSVQVPAMNLVPVPQVYLYQSVSSVCPLSVTTEDNMSHMALA